VKNDPRERPDVKVLLPIPDETVPLKVAPANRKILAQCHLADEELNFEDLVRRSLVNDLLHLKPRLDKGKDPVAEHVWEQSGRICLDVVKKSENKLNNVTLREIYGIGVFTMSFANTTTLCRSEDGNGERQIVRSRDYEASTTGSKVPSYKSSRQTRSFYQAGPEPKNGLPMLEVLLSNGRSFWLLTWAVVKEVTLVNGSRLLSRLISTSD
jgi:hypothetical protein